ncbi:MAG: hypothetical protein J6K26_09370 [Lachnospiraceae bacterium]|nr:hypothetical protein [Lachnospiraceae bacterium]
MMYNSLSELFKGICDAIRARDGTSQEINHQDIPERISSIQGGESNYFEIPESYDIECIEPPFVVFDQNEITIIEEEQL